MVLQAAMRSMEPILRSQLPAIHCQQPIARTLLIWQQFRALTPATAFQLPIPFQLPIVVTLWFTVATVTRLVIAVTH